MSQRTTLRPTPVIDDGSMAASITSQVTILQSITMPNYEVVWSGTTPIGTISVEASNDYQAQGDNVIRAGNWVPVPLNVNGVVVTAIPLTGDTGKGMIDINGLAAYAVRLVYTRTSGVGTLNATVTGKVA